jgi:hypothetical protein
MLSYDLCMKLKKAGWPQKGQHFWQETKTVNGKTGVHPARLPRFTYYEMGSTTENEKWAVIPTLEELIEACGKRFESLRLFDADPPWWADAEGLLDGLGNTPTEAVASLWLQLRKDDDAKRD